MLSSVCDSGSGDGSCAGHRTPGGRHHHPGTDPHQRLWGCFDLRGSILLEGLLFCGESRHPRHRPHWGIHQWGFGDFQTSIGTTRMSGSSRVPHAALATVVLPPGIPNGVQTLATPLVLQPNVWYYLAQGRISGDRLHYFVGSLSVPDLLAASFRISDWSPPGDSALRWTCDLPVSSILGTTPTFTPAKIAIGFQYETDNVILPQVETVSSPLTGRLLSTGGGSVALYMEYGTGISGGAITTDLILNLVQPSFDGSVPYQYTSTVASLPPSTTYYYRARVINDAGRVDGTIHSFTTPSRPDTPTITDVVPNSGALDLSLAPLDPSVSNILYSINGGPWVSRQPASTTLPLVISGLTNGQTYSVRVTVVAGGVSSLPSNSVSGTPTGIAPFALLLQKSSIPESLLADHVLATEWGCFFCRCCDPPQTSTSILETFQWSQCLGVLHQSC